MLQGVGARAPIYVQHLVVCRGNSSRRSVPEDENGTRFTLLARLGIVLA
jgi:hypothetical protein